jgi:hypothetical protein
MNGGRNVTQPLRREGVMDRKEEKEIIRLIQKEKLRDAWKKVNKAISNEYEFLKSEEEHGVDVSAEMSANHRIVREWQNVGAYLKILRVVSFEV